MRRRSLTLSYPPLPPFIPSVPCCTFHAAPLFSFSLPPSFSFLDALEITHRCYNPLVLRHRTCCPVSNTLFFFSFYPMLSLPSIHMHGTSLPYDRSVIDERRLSREWYEVRSPSSRFYKGVDGSLWRYV